jgi:hypothetical protein
MVTTIGHMAVHSRQVLVFVMVMRPRRCGLRDWDSVPPGPRERNRVACTPAHLRAVCLRLDAFGGRDLETGDASVAQLEPVRQIHGAAGEVALEMGVYTSWPWVPSIARRSIARRTSTV